MASKRDLHRGETKKEKNKTAVEVTHLVCINDNIEVTSFARRKKGADVRDYPEHVGAKFR